MSRITWEEKTYNHFGRCLFVSNGELTFAAAWNFGIRVLYFSEGGTMTVPFAPPQSSPAQAGSWACTLRNESLVYSAFGPLEWHLLRFQACISRKMFSASLKIEEQYSVIM
jgi:hypothetical protein